MNKKVVAAAACVLLLATLVSCGKGKQEETTTALPDLSGATASIPSDVQTNAVSDVSAQPVANTDSASPTYILTTQQGQTMVTAQTTAFSLETIPSTNVMIPSSFTNPSLSTPDVNTSVMPTVSTTITPTVVTDPSGQNTTKESSTEPTTAEPTTAAEKVRKYVDISSYGADPSTGNFIISFDASGWDGGVSNKTGFVTVDVDGKSYPVKASVIGKADADGNATVKVYSSELEPGDGSVITCNIPAGFITSKNGNQTSIEFSSSGTFMTQ